MPWVTWLHLISPQPTGNANVSFIIVKHGIINTLAFCYVFSEAVRCLC